MSSNPLVGRGIRERLLRLVGAGTLYDQLRAARSRHVDTLAKVSDLEQAREDLLSIHEEAEKRYDEFNSRKARESEELKSSLEALRDQVAELRAAATHTESLKANDQLLALEYPVNAKVRNGWGKPVDTRISSLIDERKMAYANQLSRFVRFIPAASAIARSASKPGCPQWSNDWFPPFDAISLYGYLADRNPKKFLEIGSGTSTTFARQSITDNRLRTRIVSIDPQPRSEIDSICDHVVRYPLEEAPLDEFESLSSEDIVFFDGSHRCFQNSDVTVFFTEILPSLPSGLLVGIHDIFLPADYPPEWKKRFYSEQYLLSCWLLAGDRLQIELPVWYCSQASDLTAILDDLWNSPNLADCLVAGGTFWFTVK